jgi:hypothetical protein
MKKLHRSEYGIFGPAFTKAGIEKQIERRERGILQTQAQEIIFQGGA